MKSSPAITGGQKYESDLFSYMKEYGLAVDFIYNEKWATGKRKLLAPFYNLKFLSNIKKYDILFFNSSKCYYWILLIFFIRIFFQKKEIIVIHHHFLFLEYSGLKKIFFKFLENLFLNLSTSILIPSPYIKHLIEKKNPKKKILFFEISFKKTIHNNINPQKGKLLYVGTIEKRKGLIYLIYSLIKVKEMGYNYSLMIIGKIIDNHYYKEILSLIEKHNLDVSFSGYISEEEKNRQFSIADIFTFPSLLEGYGMVLIEAMSFRLPVIAFNNSAIPFTIKNMYNGILVDDKDVEMLGNSIIKLVEDRELRNKLSNSAYETFKKIKNEESFKEDIKKFCLQLINKDII